MHHLLLLGLIRVLWLILNLTIVDNRHLNKVAKTCLFIYNPKGIKHKNNKRIPPKKCFSSLCLSLRSCFAFSGPDLELAVHFGSICTWASRGSEGFWCILITRTCVFVLIFTVLGTFHLYCLSQILDMWLIFERNMIWYL